MKAFIFAIAIVMAAIFTGIVVGLESGRAINFVFAPLFN